LLVLELVSPRLPKLGVADPMVVKRSVSDSSTLETCDNDCTLASSELVSALLTLENVLKPAGAMVTVLPIELLTCAIFSPTAWWAMSITRLSPMLKPRIMTIDKLRVAFRNALRTPRVIVFMCGTILRNAANSLKKFSCGKNWTLCCC
jgi:hypothetical protein